MILDGYALSILFVRNFNLYLIGILTSTQGREDARPLRIREVMAEK